MHICSYESILKLFAKKITKSYIKVFTTFITLNQLLILLFSIIYQPMSNLFRCEKILTSLIRFLSMLCPFPIPSLGNGRFSSCPKFTQVKLRFANTCEKTTKSSSIKFKLKIKEISLELVKILILLRFKPTI